MGLLQMWMISQYYLMSTKVKYSEDYTIYQEYHGVVLHSNEPKIWVLHPFSLAPTNFYVKSEKGEWWGNCAWCSPWSGSIA